MNSKYMHVWVSSENVYEALRTASLPVDESFVDLKFNL